MSKSIVVVALAGMIWNSYAAGIERKSTLNNSGNSDFTIESASLKIKTDGLVAMALLEISAVNRGSRVEELTAYFPVEKSGAVCDFWFGDINGKEETEVVECRDADKEYTEAKRKYIDPAILDVFKESYRVRITPVNPGAAVNFGIVYLIPLEICGSTARFNLNLSNPSMDYALNTVAKKFSVEIEAETDTTITNPMCASNLARFSVNGDKRGFSGKGEKAPFCLTGKISFSFQVKKTKKPQELSFVEVAAVANPRLQFESENWMRTSMILLNVLNAVSECTDPNRAKQLCKQYSILCEHLCFYSGLPGQKPVDTEPVKSETKQKPRQRSENTAGIVETLAAQSVLKGNAPVVPNATQVQTVIGFGK